MTCKESAFVKNVEVGFRSLYDSAYNSKLTR